MKRLKKRKHLIPTTHGRELLIKAVLKFLPNLEAKAPYMSNKELLNKCHPFMSDKPRVVLRNEQIELKGILKIVDSCFHEFASTHRKEAREKATKLWYNKFKKQ